MTAFRLNIRGSTPRAVIARFSAALCLLLVCLLLFRLAAGKPAWLYTVYIPFSRAVSRFLSHAASLFPQSFFELIVYYLLLSLIFSFFYTLYHLIRSKGRLFRYMDFMSRIALGAAILFSSFTIFWGLNYSADSFSRALDLSPSYYSVSELAATTRYLTDKLNASAKLAPRGEDGICDFGSFSAMTGRSLKGFDAAAAQNSFFADAGAPPKAVNSWLYMSLVGISGIYSPFTGEANVNPDIPHSQLPFTISHEISHRLGAAAEDDANFAAFIACINSPYPDYSYSGYLTAFIYCSNALYRYDVESYMEIYALLDPLVIKDLYHISEHYSKYKGPISEAGSRVNDAYLKVMGVDDGVRSYGRVVDLILSWSKDRIK